MSFEPFRLLRLLCDDAAITQAIDSLAAAASPSSSSSSSIEPVTKRYKDAVYLNHYRLGVSLCFKPLSGYSVPLADDVVLRRDRLALDSVDVFNDTPPPPPPATTGDDDKKKRRRAPEYSPLPLPVTFEHTVGSGAEESVTITHATKGVDFVRALGEPNRKGGGTAGVGVWLEWTGCGVMVELQSEGLGAWDKGGEAAWRSCTFFHDGQVA